MKLKEFLICALKCHITQGPNHITKVLVTEKIHKAVVISSVS